MSVNEELCNAALCPIPELAAQSYCQIHSPNEMEHRSQSGVTDKQRVQETKENKLERESGVRHCRSQPYPTDHTVVSNICSEFWNHQHHNNRSSSSLQTMYVAAAAAGVQNSGIVNSTATACWWHTLSASICSYD
jgi:hypothetical protein